MKTNKLVILVLVFTISLVWAQITVKARKLANRNATVNSEVLETEQLPRSISINRIGQGSTTPQTLMQNLSGVGIVGSNVSFTGRNVAGATFSGADDLRLDFGSGIILSSGAASNIAGPNNSPSKSSNNQQAGDIDLDDLSNDETFDAAVLEFDFVPQYNKISLEFILASEEYPEMIDYADVMAIFINGINIALIPGTPTPVSIGTINHLINSNLYVDNSPANNNYSAPYTAPYDLQADGFTRAIKALADVTPGTTNHVKIAIADLGDNVYDSWLLLKEDSFYSAADLQVTLTVPPTPFVGSNYTLQYSVLNNGSVGATDVELSFRLPFGSSLLQTPTNVVMNGDSGIATWPWIANGSGVDLNLSVVSNAEIWGTGVAEVSSSTLEAFPQDNRNTEWQIPQAGSRIYEALEDAPLNIPWHQGLLYHSNFSGITLPTIEITQEPMYGTLTLGTKGAFTYTPFPDFFGMDSFHYVLHDGTFTSPEAVIGLSIQNVYDPITINLLPSYSIDEDTSLSLPLADIITNPDQVNLQVLVQNYSNGSWLIQGSQLILSPNANWFGESTFSLSVFDGSGTFAQSTILIVNPVQDLFAQPASIDFGNVGIGLSAQQRLYIQNQGNSIISLQSPFIISSNPAFSISGLSAQQIQPQSSVFFDVIYAPTQSIEYAGILSILSNVFGESPKEVSLSGGTLMLPEISVYPSVLNQAWESGNSYQSQVDIVNTGETALNYQASLLQHPTWLSILNPVGNVEGGGNTNLLISANLHQVAAGSYSAIIRISSDAINDPQLDIPVQIQVIGTPQLTILESIVDFGTMYSGQLVSRSLALINSGSDVLAVNLSTSGTGFSVLPQNLSIPAFSQQNVHIRIFGNNSGSYSGQLQIQSNDPAQPQLSIPLSASLIKPPTIELSVPELRIFSIGDSFAGKQIQVSNSGEENLVWQLEFANSGDGTFWLDSVPSGGTIAPGAAQNVTISCIPTGLPGGVYEATLRFVSNDLYRPNMPINLQYIKQMYNICNFDNNDNYNSGNPDLDMGVLIQHNSPKAPIEFNIFSNISEVESARLVIRATGVNSFENCPVYFNNHSLGILIPGESGQSFSGFQLNPQWVQSQNLIRIEVDTFEQGDGIIVLQGQIVLNSMALEADILYMSTDHSSYIASETVEVIVALDTQLASQEVLIYTSLTNMQGDKLLTVNRSLEIQNGEDNSFVETIQLPETLASGSYKIVCEVFDILSGLQQDSDNLVIEVIPNQARISLSTDHVDFGVTPSGITDSYTFTISNTGNMPLQVLGFATSATEIGVIPPTGTIAPEAELDFAINFLPQEPGAFNGVLTILSNDPQYPALEIELVANVIPNLPYISVNPHYLDFGNCFIGDSRSLQIQISNPGPMTLEVNEIVLPHASYSYIPADLSIEYQQSTILSVSFTPQYEGNFNGTLQIISNAANEPVLQIPIFGTASYPPQITVSPQSVNLTDASGDIGHTELAIGNTGGSPLAWAMDENMGKALRLRGYSIPNPQYVKIPNRSEIQLVGGSFSLSLWFKVDTNLGGNASGGAINGGRQYIFSKSTTSKPGFLGIYCEGIATSENGKNLVLQARNSSGLQTLSLNNAISLNSWYNLALSYSNNQLHLYLNGESKGSIDLPGYNGNTDEWVLGKYDPESNRKYLFEGHLDEFVIFRSARTQETLNHRMYSKVHPYEQNLGGYWNWDASNGVDSSIYHTLASLKGSPSFPASTVSDTPDWISINPAWAVSEPNSGQAMQLSLDASNFLAGTYEANLKIRSNDYTQALINIPVLFNVSGNASLALSHSSLDFAEVIINTQEQMELTISNNGTAALILSDVTSNGNGFSVSINSLTLAPGQSHELPVNFNPVTATEYNGTLSFNTNLENLEHIVIPLSGTGALPPLMSYSPSSISLELDYRTSTPATVNISNAQGLALKYQASLQELSRSNVDGIYHGLSTGSRGMTWLNGKLYFVSQSSNQLRRYNPETQSIDGAWTIHNNPYSVTTDGTSLYIGSTSGRIYKYNQNLTLESSFLHPMVSFPATVVYANSNLYVMDMSTANKPIYRFNTIGNLLGQYNTQLSRSSQIIHVPEHTEAPFYALQSGLERIVSFKIASDGVQIVDTLFVPIGSCYSLAHNGRDFYILQNDMDYMRRFDDGKNEFNWVRLVNKSGSIPAGSNGNLTLNFNAFNSFAGQYNAQLKLVTNDPLHNPVIIPISMIVNGNPQYAGSTQSLDFGQCYLGYPNTLQLEIENNGSAQLLVTGFNTTEYFSSVQTSLSIPPWQKGNLEVTFNPQALGTYNGTLSFQTNDPQHPQVQIVLLGECLEAPSIVVSPSQINLSLMNDASTIVPIQIQNTGLTELKYQIWINPEGNRTSSDIRLSGDILGSIPFSYSSSGAVVINNLLYAVRHGSADMICFDLQAQVLIAEYLIHDGPYGIAWNGNDFVIGGEGGILYFYHPEDLSSTHRSVPYKSMPTNIGTLPAFTFDGTDIIVAGTFTPSPTTFRRFDANGMLKSVRYLNQSNISALYKIPNYIDSAIYAYQNVIVNQEPIGGKILTLAVDDAGVTVLTAKNVWDNSLTYTLCHDGNDFLVSDYDGPLLRVDDGYWLGTTISKGALAVNQASQIPIKLDPSGINGGVYSATIDIRSNDPASPLSSLPVSLIVSGYPQISLNPSIAVFDSTLIGASSVMQIVVHNPGTDVLQVSQIEISNPDFSLNTYAFNLPPKGSRSLSLTFSPSNQGQISATLTFTSNAVGNPQYTCNVLGFGKTPKPDLAITPASYSYGTVYTNNLATKSFKLKNIGTALLSISSYQSSDPSFSCPAVFPITLAQGDSLNIPILFSPILAQDYLATFTLISNLETDKQIVLSGTGLLPLPHLAVSPSPINIGNVVVSVSKETLVTLGNTGQLPLLINSISSQDPALIISGIPASIGAGSSVQISLLYTANTSGYFQGSLDINSNDPDTPNRTIEYHGTAIVGSPIISASNSFLSFPLTMIGEQNTRNLSITNTGNLPLNISRIDFNHNAFSTAVTDLYILPQSTATLPVIYTPTQVGSANGIMLLRNNSLNANYQITLQGSAEHPVYYSIEPEHLDISSMQAETLSRVINLSNTGNGTLIWNMQNSASWLNITPTSGTLSAGNSIPIYITISTHDLFYDQYIVNLELNSNSQSTPQKIIPVYLLFAEYGYTTNDNEDNLGSGNPDGDMDILVTHNSSLAPIEFNIFLNEAQISNAQIRILAKSLKPNSQHKVYVNNYLVGYLSAPNTEMQASNFNVDPALLHADSQTPNKVRIIHDDTVADQDGIMILWGSITCNRVFTNAHVSQLVYEPQMPIPGAQLALKQFIETNLNVQSVRVVTRLKDSAGSQVLDTHTRQMTLQAYQPANTTVIWNIPPNLAPGNYFAAVEVFDANSNNLQDSTQLPIQILANQPLVSLDLQSMSFGEVYPGFNYQKSLMVTNLGAAPLSVTGLSFSSPRFFSNLSQFSVAPGGVFELPISAKLQTPGQISAVLNLSSNDPANPIMSVNLSATGIPAPGISVSESQADIQMQQYSQQNHQLSISNIGLGTLTISDIAVNGLDWVQTQLQQNVLNAGEHATLTLTMNSTGLQDGLYFGQVMIHSNDPALPMAEIELRITLSPRTLIAEFSAEPLTGYAPLLVNFISESYSTDGSQIIAWEWDFDGDGITDSTIENPSYTYHSAGSFPVSLMVVNDANQHHQTEKQNYVFVLNSAPQIAQIIEEIELAEDNPLIGFDLSPYFSDADGDDLSYSISQSPQLSFQVEGALLSIYPMQDYYGSQQIVITASDPHSASVSQTIWVHVIPENDPPQFENLPAQIEFLRFTSFAKDFAPYVFDPDTSLDLITISISGNTNFTWSATGLEIIFSAPGDWYGVEVVTISLNDNYGRSITHEQINVKILERLDASFTISSADVLAGVPIVFQNTSPGNITHFEWDFDNDSIVDSNEEHPIHVYVLGGIKSPRLKVMHKILEDIIHEDEYVLQDGILVRGTNIPGGNAVGTWVLEDAPYNISGPITIPADGSLSIDSQVQVNIINTDVTITVHGSLQADAVSFSPLSTDRWKGFVVQDDVEFMQITNSRIENAETPFMLYGNAIIQNCVVSKDSLSVFTEDCGIKVAGSASPTIHNVDILHYSTGIEISAELAASSPTMSNIRIRNSANTLRNDAIGISLNGKVLPDFREVEIEGYPIGLSYNGDGSTLAAPPTISNIRVRNSSNSLRNNTIGIKLRNLERVVVTQDSIFNYNTAIDYENDIPELVNRPTISNVRVRNTSNTVRTENTGIRMKGNLQIRLYDIDIDDYHHGISVTGIHSNTLAATSTISNIRVRNTSNTVRNQGIGIYIQDMTRVTVSNDSLYGYNKGIVIHNSNQLYTVKPTLSNIRVRNTSNTVRNLGTGIMLSPGVDAELKDCYLQDYALGVHALGATLRMSDNQLHNNDIAVFIDSGGPGSYIEYNELIKGLLTMQNPVPAIKVLNTPSLNVINNTIYNYSPAVAASNSLVNFTNNIVWAETYLYDVFETVDSVINVSYSNIMLQQAYPGLGNLNIDPIFTDEFAWNFTLYHDSPMIDAGDPTLATDSDGSIRDIGANTYLHNAEFVSDYRFVNLDQAIQFTNQSLGHPSDISSFAWDFNNDGQIDSTLENPSWIPPALGRYDVKLIIQTGTLVDSLLLRNHILVQDIILMPPTNPRLSLAQSNITLTWDPVQTDIYGEPAYPNFYLCYANSLPTGNFRYIGETDGSTSFTHAGGAENDKIFYAVIGFAGTREQLRTFLNSRGNTIYIAPKTPVNIPIEKPETRRRNTRTP